MGMVLALVILFILIGIIRTLIGIPPLRSKSNRYNERDYS